MNRGEDVFGEPTSILFLYLGRRGISRLVLEIAVATAKIPGISANVCVSRQNESFKSFAMLGARVLPVDTFQAPFGALTKAFRIPGIRQQIRTHLLSHGTEIIVDLMPHVWAPFIIPVVREAGRRYVPLIHDAATHPGDYRSAAVSWSIRQACNAADHIVTLSEAVARKLEAQGIASRRIIRLFHPVFGLGCRPTSAVPTPGSPLRLAFFGRIMAYKGLPLFLEMAERLGRDGVDVHVGVFGEGKVEVSWQQRLDAMGAEIINRWLTEAEICTHLPHYHALVLPYSEASQSGVVATAFGVGLPVIATPVGGLVEQVRDGVDGVLARSPNGDCLAEAARRLLCEPGLYSTLQQNATARIDEQSPDRFVAELIANLLRPG